MAGRELWPGRGWSALRRASSGKAGPAVTIAGAKETWMPELGLFGWIFVGFLAGWLSGMVVDRGGPRGCCADMVVGVLGGIVGGWFATDVMHGEPATGLFSALVVAFLGATALRLIFRASADDRSRPGRRDW